MAELVQSFRFRVRLVLSTAPGANLRPPPELKGRASRDLGRPAAAGGGPAQLGDGGFQEVSGLDVESDVHEYAEGGRNDGLLRRVGRAKVVPLVLKRGVLTTGSSGYADPALWLWLQSAVSGGLPVARYDGTVEVLAPAGRLVTARWTFSRALPTKVTGPVLNARTGEVAVEELHLSHEGLRLEATR
jgi:phage tail-like protein